MVLVMMRRAGGRMMARIDRLHVEVADAFRVLEAVTSLDGGRRRWLHRREVGERLKPALIIGAVAFTVSMRRVSMWRGHRLLIVWTRAGTGRTHRWRDTLANLMLKIGVIRR